MGRKIIVYFMLLPLLCSGCHFQPSRSPQNRVVTKITVAYENGDFSSHREYSDEENIRQILNYLRYLDPYGQPEENPETATGHEYRIFLSHGDGYTREYRQKDDRFFMSSDGNWLKINPNQGQKLGWLLWEMRSDQSNISISP